MKLNCRIVFFLIWSVATLCFGQTKYMRSAATGSGNGSDWNNAYTNISQAASNATRGDIIYVAAGSYGGGTLSKTASGTSTITFRKATSAAHGTDTGWSDSYTNGQATFTPISFSTGWWIFDGGYRNESDWFDSTAYGFIMNHNGGDILVNYGVNAHSITFSNMFFAAKIHDLPTSPTIQQYTFNTWNAGTDFNGSYRSNLVWSRVGGIGSCNVWFIKPVWNAVIEYCAHSLADGDTVNNHGEIINLYWYSHAIVVRYNKFKDEYLTGGGATAIIAVTTGSDDIDIYGNIFWNFRSGDAVIGYQATKTDNIRVYNNTFYNCVDISMGVNFGDDHSSVGSFSRNNLFIKYYSCYQRVQTYTHNGYSTGASGASGDGGVDLGSNAQTNIPTSIFMSTNGDFRLKYSTTNGYTISNTTNGLIVNTFDVDMLGNVRGADGIWDRGALEFDTGNTNNPVISVSLSGYHFGAISINTSSNITVGVTNTGTGTLSGTATVSSPFSIVSGGTYSLAANQGQLVTISYAPTVPSVDTATVSFTGASGTSMSVTGAAWSILISKTALQTGAVQVQ